MYLWCTGTDTHGKLVGFIIINSPCRHFHGSSFASVIWIFCPILLVFYSVRIHLDNDWSYFKSVSPWSVKFLIKLNTFFSLHLKPPPAILSKYCTLVLTLCRFKFRCVHGQKNRWDILKGSGMFMFLWYPTIMVFCVKEERNCALLSLCMFTSTGVCPVCVELFVYRCETTCERRTILFVF